MIRITYEEKILFEMNRLIETQTIIAEELNRIRLHMEAQYRN